MEQTDNSIPIAIANLSKSFGTQKVLDGIDLTISRGQTLSLLGRSGTGKSVLLRLLVGLDKPDSGSIRIDGEEITSLGMDQLNKIRQKLGFVFQDAALYDSL